MKDRTELRIIIRSYEMRLEKDLIISEPETKQA